MPYTFTNGAGTEADPYQVWTADDLNGVRDYPSSHFIQMKHIDLSGYPDWVPIGTATFEGEEVDSNTVFSGFYNGNGYKISNLNVLTGVAMGGGFAGGLFGLAADLALINSGEPSENPPEIKNIILENVNINGGEGLLYAGGLVAYSYGIIISNCSVSGSINGYYGAGGLVGFGMVTVDNSFSSCSVVSPSGIAGSILGEGSGTVNNCYSNGTASCLYTEKTGAITMAYGCQIVSSYYDSDIAGISAEFDPDYPGYHIATPKTTAEMKQQETFVGWDFDTVWGIDPAINNGYPYLKVFQQETETPNNVVIFHDDCSSLDNWTPIYVDDGILNTDGNCIYMEQEPFGHAYNFDGAYTQNCNIGTADFEAEFQIKTDGENVSHYIQIILLSHDSYMGIGFCLTDGKMANAILLTHVDGTPITMASLFNTLKTYKLTRTVNKLELYADDALLAEYEGNEVSGIDIASIVLTLYKMTDTDESALKSPALYDIKVSKTQVSVYQFAHGSGTEQDPYQVWTADDLNGVRDYLDAYFIQMADIDLSGYANWDPIGEATTGTGHFSGHYDGNGFAVSNLTMSYSDFRAVGLFGSLFNGSIKNLGVENVNINCSGAVFCAGGLVGTASSDNKSLYNITNCYSKGIVISTKCVGLLVGSNGAPVIKCWSEGSVRAETYQYADAGGLVGHQSSHSIENSCSYANVEGVRAGGLLGTSYSGAEVINSYSGGTVRGSEMSGGLVGYSYSIYVTNCYSKCSVELTPANPSSIGGLLGYDDSTTIIYSYYDSTVSGQSDTGKGVPKTTAEMKQQATFVGWDFDTVWGINPAINDGYPYLKVFVNEEIPTIYQFTYGSGTELDPYQVWTAADLNGVRDYLSSYFIQMADIDLSGVEWDPINGNDTSFEGNYNGNGYKITNITSALFGSTKFATLKNIGLENVNITDSNGALANAILSGTIEGCYSTGTISCTGSHLGGLIGHIQGFTLDFITEIPPVIKNCYSTCTVTSTGENIDGGDQGIGIGGLFGVLGYTFGYGQIENCYSCGQVSKTSADVNINLGGLIGFIQNSSGTITNCFYDSTASGQSDQGKGEPKTTSQMKLESTYVGWDFDTIWGINKLVNNGYPFLKANISSDIAEERDFFVRSKLPITFPAIVPSSYPVLIEKHSPAAIDRSLRQESNETIFPAIEMTAGLTQVELVNKTDQAIIKPGADLSINITDANYGSRSEQINIDPSIELSIDIFDISTSKFEEQETINPSLEINISYTTIQE